ncbi:DUF1003 domain-containing protein [Microvirga pakistanensis]|uniref:DUF1003 domain-containing protein n=1 Tax=Microvirga pakistanensis TaxID=1682650 RepID=UPI00141AD4DB|nr:DUF1003 domain-containing protein [Microvirga pakistanensis]
MVFGFGLGAWILVNALRGPETLDSYPYILLNLMVSCLAAVQAPVIMMSQRRQEAKDRLRSLNDYQVNLKAEFGIRFHVEDQSNKTRFKAALIEQGYEACCYHSPYADPAQKGRGGRRSDKGNEGPIATWNGACSPRKDCAVGICPD